MTTTGLAGPTIEMRGLTEQEWSDAALDAFDTLAPGESLTLVGDSPPLGLLGRLQAERKGSFEWSPLSSGPSVFRTEVTRRSAKPGALRGVMEALAWDHDRLEALEKRTFERLAAGDKPGAELAWSDFTVGLKRHIRFEEGILFPAFEERLGFSQGSGPTAVMRFEHRGIEALIDAIGRALGGNGDATQLRSELRGLLGGHNLKEERVLYPGTDRALAPEEADALVARIQGS
jgi:uncharacterized protein (DUF2249 family)